MMIYDTIGPKPKWKATLPTALEQYRQEFGEPDSWHSFTQEACAETTLHFLFKSGFIDDGTRLRMHWTHPLIEHLDRTRVQLSNYDFTWIRNMDPNWSEQKSISKKKSKAMMAALLYFNLDASLLMRYLGNNYIASHRNVGQTVKILWHYKIDK